MVESKGVYLRKASGLVREFGARDTFLFAFGGFCLGSVLVNINVVMATVYPGLDIIWAMTITLPVFACIMLVYFFLATAMPRSGGDFVWNSQNLHPAIGFTGSFSFWIGQVFGVGMYNAWLSGLVMSTGIATYGTLTSNPSLVAIGGELATPNYTFLVGAATVLIIAMIVIFGAKYEKWVLRLSLLPNIILIVIPLWAVWFHSQAQFVANFNIIGGSLTGKPNSYQLILDLYKANGGTFPQRSLAMALPGLVFGFWMFLGCALPSFIGGEVKNPKISQMAAMFGSLIAAYVFFVVLFTGWYQVIGWDWGNAIAVLSGAPNYPLPVPPTIQFLLGILVTSPWINALFTIAEFWSVWMMNFVIYMVLERILFSYSFASVFPMKIAEVHPKYHSPWVACLITGFASIVMEAIYVYSSVFTYFVNWSVLICVAFFLASVGGIVFPFRKKEIFEGAPKPVSSKVAGIPIISIFSAISCISLALIMYEGVTVEVTTLANSFVLATVIASAVVYYVARAYRRRGGIDLDMAYRQMPPE